jgi:hypothetical protein
VPVAAAAVVMVAVVVVLTVVVTVFVMLMVLVAVVVAVVDHECLLNIESFFVQFIFFFFLQSRHSSASVSPQWPS